MIGIAITIGFPIYEEKQPTIIWTIVTMLRCLVRALVHQDVLRVVIRTAVDLVRLGGEIDVHVHVHLVVIEDRHPDGGDPILVRVLTGVGKDLVRGLLVGARDLARVLLVGVRDLYHAVQFTLSCPR